MRRLWRFLAVFVFGGVLGTGFGVALGFFLFPYVFPPPESNDTLTDAERTVVVARGAFIDANPSDPIHYGTGGVTVYRRTVFLEPGFEVGPGPKFHVYLVAKPSIRASGDVKESGYVDLGRLRSFKGSQKYAVPNGIDPKRYRSVVIWCAEFAVLIAPADLTFQ